jgi:hypothetical protein
MGVRFDRGRIGLMPRNKRIDFRIVFIVILLVVMALTFYYIGENLGFGDTTVITTNFITILPSVFLFIVGLYITVTIGGLYTIPAFGVLGFAMATLLRSMYLPPISMITPSMMSGLSIQSVMMWCVIISLLFGGIIGATTSRRKNK